MEKKKKLRVGIVFDDTLDSSDGVAQYVKGLGGWLTAQGHYVIYLVGETKLETWAGGKVYSLSKNLKVSFNGNKLSIPLPGNKKRVKTVLDKEKLDVLHIQMPYSPFMAQKAISLGAKYSVIIGTFHVFPSGWLSSFGAKLLYQLQRRNLKKFRYVFSVSTVAAKFAKQAFKLSTGPSSNLVDLSKFNKTNTPNNPGHIVFLGRLVKRKGARELIEAFAILHQNNSETHLTIGGNGPERANLEKLVGRKGLSNSVKFIGFVDEADKPDLLSSASIACFPSLGGESFGIVLIEAMAAGAGVVVGGDNPGYRSVLGDKEILLIDPKNKQIFADRLAELLSNQTLASKLHAWQTEHVKKYDINVVGQQLLSEYYSQIAKKPEASDN